MNIISKGKIKEENKKTVRFSCKNCDCIWDADEDEYFLENNINVITTCSTFYANCPNCHKMCKSYNQTICAPSASYTVGNQCPSTPTSIGKTESSRC